MNLAASSLRFLSLRVHEKPVHGSRAHCATSVCKFPMVGSCTMLRLLHSD